MQHQHQLKYLQDRNEYQERQLYLLRQLHRLQNEHQHLLQVARHQKQVLGQGLKDLV